MNSTRGEAISARVVVVTPEGFCSSSFSVFMARQQAGFNIDIVIIDKAHYILLTLGEQDRGQAFRPAMEKVLTIISIMCDKRLFITGTLPPFMEPVMRSMVGAHDGCVVVRERARSAQHGYGYVHLGHGVTFLEVVRPLLRRLGGGNKALLLFKGRDECTAAGQELGALVYHSRVDDKGGVISAWLRDNGIMCTISSLLQGLEIEGITLVVMHGAYSILDMIQAFERTRGISTTVLVDKQESLAGQKRLLEYAEASCRRAFLDVFLNGDEAQEYRTGENPCDNYQARSYQPPILPITPLPVAVLSNIGQGGQTKSATFTQSSKISQGSSRVSDTSARLFISSSTTTIAASKPQESPTTYQSSSTKMAHIARCVERLQN